MARSTLTRREVLTAVAQLGLFGSTGCAGLQFAKPGPKRWQALTELMVERTALNYALDSDEDGEFKASWDLSQRLTRHADVKNAKELRGADHLAALEEVSEAFSRLRSAVHGQASQMLGHRRVRWERGTSSAGRRSTLR